MPDQECISSRAVTFVPQAPQFFDVLDDLWHPESNPNGIVNLGLAENLHASPHTLTYGDGFTGSKRLKTALCQFLNRYFKPLKPLQPAHLFATPGVGNALECCAWSLFDQGDSVLIGRPYWSAFNYIFKIRAQVDVREVSFGTIDPFSLDAVWEYEKEFIRARKESKPVKAILLCSPHNPLGRCYSEEVLKAYMRLCGKLDLHLISDEIYGLSDFGATGLRIGCLVSQSNSLFLKSLESFSLFNFPSSLADGVVASLLEDRTFIERFIVSYRKRLAESYAYAGQFFRTHGIPYMEANASLFLMINLGAVVQDKTLTDSDILVLLRKKKVYVAAGSGYRIEQSGWFRLVIAHPEPVLDEGLRRIVEALMLQESSTLESARIAEKDESQKLTALRAKTE
ncbi:hypothetical protein GRF29_1g162585 [Pseudopithomyces chartarum]|uniref:Aminotransferase class I/classII large domain-containing protein n=1 Tax=Pseudopithomyces chartarum TaxID=1892770 RepID=A0AAN6M8V9_9PLEO|nr:hypothetical protein GRF29_1g162585 [Pseudopithomyces chartarum]